LYDSDIKSTFCNAFVYIESIFSIRVCFPNKIARVGLFNFLIPKLQDPYERRISLLFEKELLHKISVS